MLSCDTIAPEVDILDTFFLLNLRISGIKNIEKPVEIPFYKKTIKDDFNPDQYRIKGIYGENGSGKTAIMTAVNIMTRMILEKNYLTDSVNQQLLVECINKKTGKGFIEADFYSIYDEEPFIFRYCIRFSINDDGRVDITGEILEKKNGRYTQNAFSPVFETKDGNLLQFGDSELFDYCKQKTINLLQQRSFATFANDLSISDHIFTTPPLRHLLALVLFAISIHVVINEEDDHRDDAYQKLQKYSKTEILRENDSFPPFTWRTPTGKHFQETTIPKSLLPYYQEYTDRLSSFIRVFKTDLIKIELETKEYGESYICRRVMVYDGYRLDEEYESRGIRKLMTLFDALDAACRGRIVFIDELDSNINDVYLNKLIEYFSSYGNGQLCFTAHNLSPMSVLRDSKSAISFISSVNTVHTWTSNGNQNPANAYRDGFIEDSPFNVDASDFLGILGGADE